MYAVGRIGSYISQGVYTASGPFHPFGGAVDIIVVQQQDGSFKSSPWYVKFGKFQGVLKSKEKVVNISVNGVDADFHMYLDNKGEAYFLEEVDVEEGDPVCCISSSGEEADGKPSNRRQVKSKRFDYDSDQATSVSEINLSHGKILAKTNSCKSRIWGFVSGRKSMKQDRFPEEGDSTGVLRTESMERAEIAADLLEVKWSTNSLPTWYEKHVDSTSSVLPVSDSDADKGLQIDDQNSKVDPVESNSVNGRSHEEERHPVEEMYSSMSTLTEAESFLVKSGVELSCAVDGNGDQANESLHVPHGCGDVCAEAESLNEMTELIPEVSFQPEACLLVAKESFSIEGGYRDDNCCKRLNDATVLENEEISSCSLSNNTVTETYSQILTIHRVNGSIEEVELQGLVSITGFENSSDQVVDEKVIEKEDSCGKLKLSLQPVGDPQHITDSQNDLTEFKRISSSEGSEEEQLPFGELDDFISGGNACIDSDLPDPAANEFHPSFISRDIETLCQAFSSFPEANSLPEKFIQKDFPSDEDLRIGPKRVSSEIDIPASGQVVGEEDRRIVKSLPTFWSHKKNAHDLSESSEVIAQNESSQEQAANKNTVSEDLKTVPSPFAGDTCKVNDASGGSWRLWSFPFKKSQSTREIQPDLNCKRNPEAENASKSSSSMEGGKDGSKPKVSVKETRVLTPTTGQLASLNLKEGRNEVVFTFATGMLGKQQVDARIYLWRWDTRIVISDVDGTITKSDVLGQFMPLVGMDWSQTGVTHFFSAIKENGYQFLFLSARSISQAYHTRKFLFNLKQDGKALPDGPVVISPDGLFPSLFREVIRRAPHEFKIACLEEIKALFPSDRNPFYAGFGNRDTDEISYLKVGIPKGKIFIINPKGEVSVHRRVDTKSYASLNALVHGMFPSISSSYEQEDFNSWNYWRLPPPSIGI